MQKKLSVKEAWKLLQYSFFYMTIIILIGTMTDSGFTLFVGVLVWMAAVVVQPHIRRKKATPQHPSTQV